MNLLHRSGIQAYRNCPQLRLLSYEWEGTGLEAVGLKLDAIRGEAAHQGMATLLTGGGLPAAVLAAKSHLSTAINAAAGEQPQEDFGYLLVEQQAWLEGMLHGFSLSQLPLLREDYEVGEVEQERLVELAPDLPPLALRFDAVARRKADGRRLLLDWKFTKSTDTSAFQTRWEYETQTFAYVKAAEKLFKEPIAGILYWGCHTGERRLDKMLDRTIQLSPFCYGYRRPAEIKTQYSSTYKHGNGWERFAVWEEMPIDRWLIDHLAKDLHKEFVQAGPFHPPPHELERWWQQAAQQEYRIHKDLSLVSTFEDDPETQATLRGFAFPLHETHCHRLRGYPCEMLWICYNDEVAKDPLASGLYRRRTPHHRED